MKKMRTWMMRTKKESTKEFQQRIIRDAPVYHPLKLEDLASDHEYYVYPQETWDDKECAKRTKHNFANAYGDRGYPGQVQDCGAAVHYYGTQRYNGGFHEGGQWYPGYFRPYPRLHKDYEYCRIVSWGVYIRKKQQKD
jgi:hypothetical protein